MPKKSRSETASSVKTIGRVVTESDWKETGWYSTASFPIMDTVLDGQAPHFHLGWIALLYKKYRLGDWNNVLPDPEDIPDESYLMWHHEACCMFHRTHAKFGKEIIECAHPYAENVFAFYDYSSLKLVFDVLDQGRPELQTPYVPIYHAHPHDRYDYRNGQHLWEV